MVDVHDEFITKTLSAISGVELDFETTFEDLTTLRVGGKPRATVRCQTPEALAAAVGALDEEGIPLVIVGGGSNLLVADGDLDIVAVTMEFSELTLADDGLVRAQSGLDWDAVVAASVEAGLGGIECLSGIPGKAGAVPVQNVGAYGSEISDTLTRVRLFDRHSRRDEWVSAQSLELAYRYSNLKFTSRAVVLEIELQLTTDGLSAPLRFGQLTQNPGERRPVAEVRQQVLELRAGKGMVLNPADHDTWSAGSFFTNPIVEPAVADRVQQIVREARGDEDADRMPRHPSGRGDDTVKLSAAWLIERAGFAKGYPGSGPATLSTKHTLALTNRGEAQAADVVALARDIRAGVDAFFGVTLEPEPVWLGCSIDGAED